MRVQKIKITNFKSIRDLYIDFDRMEGLWKIGGDVGTGKTTIGESIIWGLFGDIKGKNNKDLITWGEKNSSIELWIRSKDKDIYILRENKLTGSSNIKVYIDKEELHFTNKRDAQYRLETEFYDTSKLTLEMLCIISFNNFKSIATLNTSGLKDFLDQVFGFYILSNYSDKCKDERIKCEYNIKELQNKILNKQEQISRLEYINKLDRIEGNITDIINEINSLHTCYNNIKKDKLSDLASQREIQTDITQNINDIKNLGTNKRREISLIKSGKCPTCGASISGNDLESKEKELNILLQNYNEENNKLKLICEDIKNKERELEDITAAYNKKEKLLNEKIIMLREQDKRLGFNNDEIINIKNELDSHKKQLVNYEKDLQEWKLLYNTLTIDIKQNILSSFVPLLNQSICSYTKQLQLPYIVQFTNKFVCTIKLIGTENEIPISSLSTGQLKTIDISIILGIIKTIMCGINFNILFLDELISNMHYELRDSICKVLKANIQSNQTIFVISHVDLDQTYFNGRIECNLVENKNNIPYSQYKILNF